LSLSCCVLSWWETGVSSRFVNTSALDFEFQIWFRSRHVLPAGLAIFHFGITQWRSLLSHKRTYRQRNHHQPQRDDEYRSLLRATSHFGITMVKSTVPQTHHTATPSRHQHQNNGVKNTTLFFGLWYMGCCKNATSLAGSGAGTRAGTGAGTGTGSWHRSLSRSWLRG
jgi:hypothetical protein